MSLRRISLFTILFLSLSATSALASINPDLGTPETPQFTSQAFDEDDMPLAQVRRRARGDFMEALDLSEAQRNELQNIRNEYQPRLRERGEVLINEKQMLQNMMVNDTASTSELRRQHQEVQSLREEISDLRFESMLEMREVLTPEQREELAELMDERRENRGWGGRGRSPGFRGGRFNDEF